MQPDLLYLAAERHADSRRHSLRRVYDNACRWATAVRVRKGFTLGHRVLALGSREQRWLEASLPQIRNRLGSYVLAPRPEDRLRLLEVRAQRRQETPSTNLRFLWIGRWARHKGPEALLSWALQHLRAHPEDSLTIAGAGSLPDDAAAAIACVGAGIRWVPSFCRADLPALLRNHDVGLFTSTVEGWGVSLQEMLESGLPVWATDAGATEELVQYFPRQLRAFPPAASENLGIDDLSASHYLERFNWRRIGDDYEAQLIQATRPPDLVRS